MLEQYSLIQDRPHNDLSIGLITLKLSLFKVRGEIQHEMGWHQNALTSFEKNRLLLETLFILLMWKNTGPLQNKVTSNMPTGIGLTYGFQYGQ